MFIFAGCLRSSDMVTPVKYDHDILQATSDFIIMKNWEK